MLQVTCRGREFVSCSVSKYNTSDDFEFLEISLFVTFFDWNVNQVSGEKQLAFSGNAVDHTAIRAGPNSGYQDVRK